MALFGRSGVARLRRQADVESRAVRSCLQDGAYSQGLRHSTRHEKIVRTLLRRDPDVYHEVVLVGLFYNRAALLDALGAGPAAIAAALEAVDRYETLDPVRGAPDEVRRQLRAARESGSEPEAARFIAQAADARARLARLYARYEGPRAAAAVHRYGTAAVQTYEALEREGAVDAGEVARIRRQYEAAQEHLA